MPAPSVARTENWCSPSPRPEYVLGVAQAIQAPPSSLHSKLEPDSVEVKEKLAVAAVVIPLGPLVIEVSGGVVSGGGEDDFTIQLSLAGVGSTLPAPSVARTENWWVPRARPE